MVLKADATDADGTRGTHDGEARGGKEDQATSPAPEPAVDLSDPDRFINRELSWLDFNHRVIEEADNPRHPLLERLRFLSISASNLDEFYSVRVAALIGQAKAGGTHPSADGRTAAQQLAAIKTRAELLLVDQQRILGELLTLLRDAGVSLCHTDSLSEADKVWLDAWFMERVFPVVTPLAVDPAHPFPFISNFGLVLALHLVREDDGVGMRGLLPLPSQIDRFIRLPAPRTVPAGALHPARRPGRAVPPPGVSRLPPHRPRPVPGDPRHRRGIRGRGRRSGPLLRIRPESAAAAARRSIWRSPPACRWNCANS